MLGIKWVRVTLSGSTYHHKTGVSTFQACAATHQLMDSTKDSRRHVFELASSSASSEELLLHPQYLHIPVLLQGKTSGTLPYGCVTSLKAPYENHLSSEADSNKHLTHKYNAEKA